MPNSQSGFLELDGFCGLSDEVAKARLEELGPNELSAQKKRRLLAIVLEVVQEPMFIMLIVAGGLYLAVSNLGDAMMLLGFVFFGDLFICVASGLACIVCFDLLKIVRRPARSSIASGV